MNKWLLGVAMWMVFLCSGCGDGDKITYYESDLFAKNNITDVVEVFQCTWVEEEGAEIYYGIRKGKDWFALFDTKSGLLKEEWYGKERFYDKKEPLGCLSSGALLFKKLKNGEYVHLYGFDGVGQIVYLLPDQRIRYGLVLKEGMDLRGVLEGKGFLGRKSEEVNGFVVYDFDGNVCVDNVSIRRNDTSMWYCGFQGDKVWVGFYDEEGDFREVVGKENFERKRKVHVGYGEYKDVYIDNIHINEVIKTDFGYVFRPSYWSDRNEFSSNGYYSDIFFINNGELIFIPLDSGYSQDFRKWYDGSYLVDRKYVLSSEGNKLVEFTREASGDLEPLSYSIAVEYRYRRFDCYDYANDEQKWYTFIDKLNNVQSDAKITMSLLEKRESVWKYRCDIVNRDGSKSNFKFELNIEDGKMTYL